MPVLQGDAKCDWNDGDGDGNHGPRSGLRFGLRRAFEAGEVAALAAGAEAMGVAFVEELPV